MTTSELSDTVESVMESDLVTCRRTTKLTEIAQLMRDHDIGDVLVVDTDNQLEGIVTDRDLVVRGIASGSDQLTADDVMTAQLATVESLSPRVTAAELMAKKAIRRLPVVDAGRLVGIVTLGDLAEDHAPSTVLGEISDAPPNN